MSLCEATSKSTPNGMENGAILCAREMHKRMPDKQTAFGKNMTTWQANDIFRRVLVDRRWKKNQRKHSFHIIPMSKFVWFLWKMPISFLYFVKSWFQQSIWQVLKLCFKELTIFILNYIIYVYSLMLCPKPWYNTTKIRPQIPSFASFYSNRFDSNPNRIVNNHKNSR